MKADIAKAYQDARLTPTNQYVYLSLPNSSFLTKVYMIAKMNMKKIYLKKDKTTSQILVLIQWGNELLEVS